MRVVIVTVGSWGDVAPFIGLGTRLQHEGHTVAIATQQRFAPMIEAAGLSFRLLPGDMRALLRSDEGQQWQTAGGGLRALRASVAISAQLLADVALGIVAATEDADVLLLQRGGLIHGYLTAQARGIPAITLELFPGVPTRAFQIPSLGTPNANRFGGNVMLWLFRHVPTPLDGSLKAFERSLGLPAKGYGAVRMEMLSDERHLILHGYSPVVAPRPDDWRPGVEVVGYWWPVRPAGWAPPDRLVDFLASGPPPVYVGFGSMAEGDAARVSDVVTAALERAGVRGVVQAGWAGLTSSSDDLLVIDDVPHDWLFPQVAAVVHHAGAGTTGAAVRAGVPAVPVPLLADQPFWADRLVKLGLAPAAVPFGELTADRLGDAVRQVVTEPGYRQRAAAIAERVRAEDGAARVAEVLAGLDDGGGRHRARAMATGSR